MSAGYRVPPKDAALIAEARAWVLEGVQHGVFGNTGWAEVPLRYLLALCHGAPTPPPPREEPAGERGAGVSDEPHRIDFPNGWSVDVHMRKNGAVYFRRWEPGITDQGMWDGLMRMSEDRFDAQVAEHGGTVAGPVHAFPPELFHDA